MYKLIDSKKFHHMNATVETVKFDDDMVVKRLVSYESVVCDVCSETDMVYLYPRFQYSPTTIRQLTRFLNEYAPLENERWKLAWNIALIRDLYAKADSDGFAELNIYGVFFLDHVLGTNLRW